MLEEAGRSDAGSPPLFFGALRGFEWVATRIEIA
jgi:hypothetical protein